MRLFVTAGPRRGARYGRISYASELVYHRGRSGGMPMPIRARATLITTLLFTMHAAAHVVAVRDTGELTDAVTNARAGDDIVLADGTYAVLYKLHADASGTVTAPITVRAEHKLGARILSSDVIGFEVTGANWHFADLDIYGTCRNDTDCEHAFHVVGNASGFHLTGSRLSNFNAHLKVNADGERHLPADGLVENNEFFDSHPRHTDNPVAPVNIDDSVNWIVRGNLIHDFQKDGSGEGSYGAFVKGGSTGALIERNMIQCASNHASLGQMVGLSFGAHGMAPQLCPPHWDAAIQCSPEVTAGIMRNNIIGNCSDDGIYLNKASDSKILYNTLIRTGGIEFRFPASSGVARGNLMTGTIRATDGGHFTDGGNASGIASEQALANWQTPQATGTPHLRNILGPDADVADDYCGRPRGPKLEPGALQTSLGPCPLLHWPGRGQNPAAR